MCFPYVSVVCLVRGLGDSGGVPGPGVDVEGGQDPGLEWAAAGDEPADLRPHPALLGCVSPGFWFVRAGLVCTRRRPWDGVAVTKL